MSTSHIQLQGLQELQTRFLYPFFFKRESVKEAGDALGSLTHAGKDGTPLRVWESARPHELYKDELLEHVVQFLFQNPNTSGYGYLKLSDPLGNRWFNKVVAQMPDGTKIPVGLVTPMWVELFLSSYGIGILSLALTPKLESLTIKEATDFNYRLSQLHKGTAARLYIQHPSDDEELWNKLSQDEKSKIGAPPAQDAPLGGRLGRPGGVFFLRELIDELLHPLNSNDLELQRVQHQLSVYTAARFGDDVDFEQADVCKTLGPFLSALAQIEEPNHAGAPAGTVGVTNSLLNRRHWVGMGLLGAAHIVADQPPPQDKFNSARLPRITLKYFVPYLVAFLQRIALHRVNHETGGIVLSPDKTMPLDVVGLRGYLLEFAVEGYFTEVSYREVIHRYYRLCQEGLNVRSALDDARRAIADIDAQNVVQRQMCLAEELSQNVKATINIQKDMTKQLQIVAGIQMKVEWIEIFIIGFYFAELMHIIISLFEKEYHLALWWSTLLVLLSGVLTGVIAWWIINPSQHKGSEHQP
jgi:hypothetical protein